MPRVYWIAGLMTLAAPGSAAAQETIAYSYDVHGRVVELDHCGSVNDERVTTYAYDLADNRTERERDASGSCPLMGADLDDLQRGEANAVLADRARGGGDAAGLDGGDAGLEPAAGPARPLHDR